MVCCVAYDRTRLRLTCHTEVRHRRSRYPEIRTPHPFLVREATPAYGSAPAPNHVHRFVTPEPDPVPRRGTPVPDPFTDADALEELEEEVVTLAAHIHAATHRLLSLIAEFDRRRGWELGGHRSAAHWLSFRTGIDLGAAREKVRAARALEELRETSASMARGELSFSKVRALTRVATPENEGDLVELARGSTTAQLERMVRAFRGCTREKEADLDRIRHERRCLSVFPDEDGMYVVRGRLPAEVGALLMRAVEAASDALFREEMEKTGRATSDGRPLPEAVPMGTLRSAADSERRAARRRADALGLLAERALVVGFENGPVSGTRAARYQVVLHVEPETLRTPQESKDAASAPGRSELEDGTRVSAETSQRLSCDAAVVRVTHASSAMNPAQNWIGDMPHGSILDVGRKTRSIPPSLRRALEVRDRGCRFPGCGSRFTDAHHVRHWADGGETSLDNCVLLCHHHHRLVHEGGWKVDWWGPGRPVFFDPRGGTHFEGRWQPPGKGGASAAESGVDGWRKLQCPELGVDGDDRVEALIRDNRHLGVDPDGWTPSARWKREADIPDEVLFQVAEALCG